MTIPMPDEVRPRKVWRYLSLDRFAWLLTNRQLWLARGDLLGDPQEGLMSARQIATWLGEAWCDPKNPYPTAEAAIRDLFLFSHRLRAAFYASCWCESEHELDAMWRMYCPSPESVAIQTTMGRLRDSLPADLEVLPVRYADDEAFGVTIRNVATRKREAFKAENEIRILRFGEIPSVPVEVDPTAAAKMMLVEWLPADHVEQIRLHPKATEAVAEAVASVVRVEAPALLGAIRPSSMVESPWSKYFPIHPPKEGTQ
jgi:hypothetical protein